MIKAKCLHGCMCGCLTSAVRPRVSYSWVPSGHGTNIFLNHLELRVETMADKSASWGFFFSILVNDLAEKRHNKLLWSTCCLKKERERCERRLFKHKAESRSGGLGWSHYAGVSWQLIQQPIHGVKKAKVENTETFSDTNRGGHCWFLVHVWGVGRSGQTSGLDQASGKKNHPPTHTERPPVWLQRLRKGEKRTDSGICGLGNVRKNGTKNQRMKQTSTNVWADPRQGHAAAGAGRPLQAWGWNGNVASSPHRRVCALQDQTNKRDASSYIISRNITDNSFLGDGKSTKS